jgi:tRNA(Ile)-lysidine synthase
MRTTQPVQRVREAVAAALDHVGPGLYGVACSGGADSMVLADAAIAVAGAPHVVTLTIDHGLQACPDVAAWARGLGAAAVTRRVVVPARASLEAAARQVRYAALDALADELGLAVILTAHTARDQAETVLLRILRGTGPAGLVGIPARRGRLLRPLLDMPREVIDAYAGERVLPIWSDPMNDDRRFARARVRHDVLPALRRDNPRVDAALIRLAASTAEWLAVIDDRASRFAALPIACTALAAEPAAIRKRALALALDRAGLGYDAAHLDQLDRLIRAPARGEVGIDLPGGRIVRSYDDLDLVHARTLVPLIAPPGYELRTWRAGDRMRLRAHSRKLSDLFIDAKIPRERRAAARVLVRQVDRLIVWAEHLGRASDLPDHVVVEPTRSAGSF